MRVGGRHAQRVLRVGPQRAKGKERGEGETDSRSCVVTLHGSRGGMRSQGSMGGCKSGCGFWGRVRAPPPAHSEPAANLTAAHGRNGEKVAWRGGRGAAEGREEDANAGRRAPAQAGDGETAAAVREGELDDPPAAAGIAAGCRGGGDRDGAAHRRAEQPRSHLRPGGAGARGVGRHGPPGHGAVPRRRLPYRSHEGEPPPGQPPPAVRLGRDQHRPHLGPCHARLDDRLRVGLDPRAVCRTRQHARPQRDRAQRRRVGRSPRRRGHLSPGAPLLRSAARLQ